jgi:uncharacterized RDD family membrane protein YckC
MASTVPGLAPEVTAPPTRVTGRRIAAGLLDVIVLGAVFTALALAIGDSDTSGSGVSLHLGGAPALLWFVIVVAYYFVPEWLAGRTLGKAALGLLVVPADGGVSDRAGAGAIAVRTVLRLVDGLPFLYGLGLLVVVVSPQNQRIGDLAARTVVVRG